jgi:hypothetical protein
MENTEIEIMIDRKEPERNNKYYKINR